MAAITGCTPYNALPAVNKKLIVIVTPSSADSNDTIDVSSATATGGDTLKTIVDVVVHDQTTGDYVTATVSGTTITIDASGGTTDHVYALWVLGN